MKKRSFILILASSLCAYAEQTADVKRGQAVFIEACASCHAIDQPRKLGPDLTGIMGRRAGSVAGFRYSGALKRATFNWGEESLEAFLKHPQEKIPGNTMPYPGLPDADLRRDLVLYLSSLTPKGR